MTIFPGLSNALKGIGGEYEITRLIGGFGALAYVVGAHVFLAWNQTKGINFDLTTYCVAFPAGLGVAIGATAGASAVKDRSVASAKVIEQTGTVPSKTPMPEGEAKEPPAAA
jgi:hypothetical protein